MLVLSRKHNEEIVIRKGDIEISVIIVDIRGDKVRLGLNAEADVLIYRREVLDAIERDGVRPATSALSGS